jgi:outer membrane protein TolC
MTPFLALAGMFAGAQGAPTTLTLDEALRYADQNAFSILIQQTRVEKQRQEANAAAGRLGPKVDVTGNYTHYDQPTTATFGTQTFTIQPIVVANGGASVSLPIDISGNMHRLVRASKANYYAQEETLLANREDVRRQVRTGYFAVLRASSQVKVAQEAVTGDQLRADNEEARYKQGVVAQVDVLRAQTQLSKSQSTLIADETALSLAKEQFNNILGRPIETPFEAVDIPTQSNVSADPEALTKQAESQRHEAKALQQTVSALTEIQRATEQGTMPTLNASLGYVANVAPLGFGQRPQVWAASLALNWPVFDSGVTSSNVKAAGQDVEQAKLQLRDVRLQISLDVRTAITALVNAQARFSVANHEVDSAAATLKAAQAKQQNGVGILLEVIDAQRDLTAAETDQLTARYDVQQAIADLQRAVGSDQLGG